MKTAKKQLDLIVEAFVEGEISDDDAKKFIDAVADKVQDGTFAKRVGTKLERAVKKVKKPRKKAIKEIDNYRRLLKHVSGTTSGLQALVDGETPIPSTETEREAAICIKAALPNLCLQIARLGVDLVEMNETFFKGDQRESRLRRALS